MSLEIVIRDATADDAQGIVNLWNPIIKSGIVHNICDAVNS